MLRLPRDFGGDNCSLDIEAVNEWTMVGSGTGETAWSYVLPRSWDLYWVKKYHFGRAWDQGRCQLHLWFLKISSFLWGGRTVLRDGEPCTPWRFPDAHSLGTSHTYWRASLAKCGRPFEPLPRIHCSVHLPDFSFVLMPVVRPPEVPAQCSYMFDVPERRGNT